MNIDYSRFYRGTEPLKTYGHAGNQKDTLVKYQFNTTDEHGNKVMEKMSKEETLQAMKDIRSQYGDNVIIEFSGDGMAALIESRKGMAGAGMTQEQQEAIKARNAAFQSEIKHYDRSADHLPAYSGIYSADKALAVAVENCGKEERAFVYNIVRQNFLIGNSSSMTEEERQANISLGMKKAEYAAGNFIPERSRSSFLEAMETIARLASAGKADDSGMMDYGVKKGNYLGSGSGLVYTTDVVDMMRTMDSKAYAEYRKIDSSGDGGLSSLKYLVKWHGNAIKKNPSMVADYEKKSDEFIEKNVVNRKLDMTFAGIKTENKQAFLESLRTFRDSNPGFLSAVINRELALKFWNS